MKKQNLNFTNVATGFLVAIFLLSSRAVEAKFVHGQTQLPGFVRVLSFDELMSLPKAKRFTYVRGLREMMNEVESRKPRWAENFFRQNSLQTLPDTSRIAQLLQLYDRFESTFEVTALADDQRGVGNGLPFSQNGTMKCNWPSQPMSLAACESGTDCNSKSEKTFVCRVGQKSKRACGRGLVPVNQDRESGEFYCATSDSYSQLDEKTKNQAGTINYQPTAKRLNRDLLGMAMPEDRDAKAANEYFAKMHPTPEFRSVVTGQWRPENFARARSEAVSSSVRDSGVKFSTTPPVIHLRETKTEAAITVAPVPAVARGAAVAAPVSKASKPVSQNADPAKKDSDTQAANSAPNSEKDVATVVVKPVTSSLQSCEPESETPKSCNSSEVESARRKYATDPDPDCIYAGSISTYVDGKKRPYNCQAPSVFCFGSLSCRNDDGEKRTPDYKCDAGQVICNPLIFGLQHDGTTPFCVDKGAEATASCDSESSTIEDGVSPLDQKHAGLKEAWNDFADHLFEICHTNQTAAALHCAECDVITKRLFALDVAARDVTNCGAAIKYQDSNCDADGKCSRPGSKTNSSGSKTGRERATPAAHATESTSSVK